MINVFLCGNNNTALNKNFHNILDKYGGIELFSRNNVYSTCSNPRFIIYENKVVPNVKSKNGIVIFNNQFYTNENSYIKNCIPILNSQNLNAVRFLKNSFSIAITCGLSLRDTLCPSSIDFPNNIITLQRDILSISGKVIEPHDFRVTLSKPISMFDILSLCGVLLLSDIPSLNGYIF